MVAPLALATRKVADFVAAMNVIEPSEVESATAAAASALPRGIATFSALPPLTARFVPKPVQKAAARIDEFIRATIRAQTNESEPESVNVKAPALLVMLALA